MKPYPRKISLIVPDNDLESRTIINLARDELGFDDIRISAQAWGATLEREPPATLENLRKEVWIVEIPGPEIEKGLQLQGHVLRIIDHHSYKGLNRSNSLSSLEQFANACDHQMTSEERAVAINDRDYIWGLVSEGKSFDSVLSIRKNDLICQGWSTEDIARAGQFYESLSQQLDMHEKAGSKLFFCRVPFSRSGHLVDLFHLPDRQHHDRLYHLIRTAGSGYPRENLLLLTTDPDFSLLLSGVTKLKTLFLSHFYPYARDYWYGGGADHGFAGLIFQARFQKADIEDAIEQFLWKVEDAI